METVSRSSGFFLFADFAVFSALFVACRLPLPGKSAILWLVLKFCNGCSTSAPTDAIGAVIFSFTVIHYPLSIHTMSLRPISGYSATLRFPHCIFPDVSILHKSLPSDFTMLYTLLDFPVPQFADQLIVL